MAPSWKPQPIEVHREWLNAILDEAMDDLSGWELKFIADMETLLAQGVTLTEGQEKKLESIYAENTT